MIKEIEKHLGIASRRGRPKWIAGCAPFARAIPHTPSRTARRVRGDAAEHRAACCAIARLRTRGPQHVQGQGPEQLPDGPGVTNEEGARIRAGIARRRCPSGARNSSAKSRPRASPFRRTSLERMIAEERQWRERPQQARPGHRAGRSRPWSLPIWKWTMRPSRNWPTCSTACCGTARSWSPSPPMGAPYGP